MPIYEYECLNCGRHEEAFQKMSDKPLAKCPHCSGKLQKLISQSSFHLKGSGWYITDYANKKNAGPPAPDANKTAAGADGGAEKSTDKTDKKQAKTAAAKSEN